MPYPERLFRTPNFRRCQMAFLHMAVFWRTFAGLQERLSRPAVEKKTLKNLGKPCLPLKSFLCGSHFFQQRKAPHWSRAVCALFFPKGCIFLARAVVQTLSGTFGTKADLPFEKSHKCTSNLHHDIGVHTCRLRWGILTIHPTRQLSCGTLFVGFSRGNTIRGNRTESL